MIVLSVEQGDRGTWARVAKNRPKLLKGLYRDVEMRHIPAPVAAASNNAQIPVELLRAATRVARRPITVVGHSTECAYICKAVRDGVFDGIPADQLSFMLLANPERKYGGWTRVPAPLPVPWKITFEDVVGLPDDILWRVTDLARRYDSVGDAPNVVRPSLLNRTHSLTAGWLIHGAYDGVSADDKDVKRLVEGNITYLLHGQVDRLMPQLEQGYDRPAAFR